MTAIYRGVFGLAGRIWVGRWFDQITRPTGPAHASRTRSSRPPASIAPAAQAASTLRPAHGLIGIPRGPVVTWMASPAGHGCDLLQVALPVGVPDGGCRDREQVQQAEDDPDGHGGIPDRGGYAEPEQANQDEVQD